MKKTIKCGKCEDGIMVKKKKTEGKATGCALALIVLLVGALLCFTGIGAIIGIPLIIVSLFIGGKKKQYMVCKSCGYIYETI